MSLGYGAGYGSLNYLSFYVGAAVCGKWFDL